MMLCGSRRGGDVQDVVDMSPWSRQPTCAGTCNRVGDTCARWMQCEVKKGYLGRTGPELPKEERRHRPHHGTAAPGRGGEDMVPEYTAPRTYHDPRFSQEHH